MLTALVCIYPTGVSTQILSILHHGVGHLDDDAADLMITVLDDMVMRT